MRFAAPFVAAVLALAAMVQARPVAQETIPGLVKKADFLIVGQVIKIEDAGEEQSATYKMPVIHKRATIRVIRGIKSSDASAVDLSLVTVEYLAVKGDAAPDAPLFPRLQNGETAIFPLKLADDKTWHFVSDEDAGMIAPAVAQEIGVGWPADIDGNIAFVYRELAGAFLYGDFATMCYAAGYLDALGPTRDQPVDTIYALVKAEIGDSLLREDTRWMTIASAAYIASGTPRPTLDALMNGMVAAGGGAARAPTDGLPAVASLRLSALTLRQAGKFQLAERILMLLISHQEELNLAPDIAKALVDNFNGAPMMVSMEEQLIRTGKPGAMFVADYMVKDPGHPLAAAAALGARVDLAADGPARAVPESAAYSNLLRQAEGLLLRVGSDDDFAFLLDQINQAHLHDAKTYEAIIRLAGDSELSPPDRVLKLCQQYIDDNAPMAFPPFSGFRLSDMAALTAARIGKQDFGLSPTDPVEKRDAAVAKASAWLKGRP